MTQKKKKISGERARKLPTPNMKNKKGKRQKIMNKAWTLSDRFIYT